MKFDMESGKKRIFEPEYEAGEYKKDGSGHL